MSKQPKPDLNALYIENPILWANSQPRWTVADLRKAIHTNCRDCNQVFSNWDGLDPQGKPKDCVSWKCPLFPFRPGSSNTEVNGIKRATSSAGRKEAGRLKARFLGRQLANSPQDEIGGDE